jgi:hypothetical protein
MSKVRLYGSTSGYVDLKAPDVAGDVTITLPNASGPFALESYVDDEIAAIPQIAGIGSNVVQTVKTDVFSTSSATDVDITGLTATITPSVNTAKVLIIAQVSHSLGASGGRGPYLTLAGGNANTFIGNADGSRQRAINGGRMATAQNELLVTSTFIYLDSPATASPVTYSARIRVDTGTVYVNRSDNDSDLASRARGVSSLTVIEVAP